MAFKPDIDDLFTMNRAWAMGTQLREPGYFERLAAQQAPDYLWIGCADSRVPANEIVGLPPGEIFVHRNIANVVVHTDLNCLSVIQYAVQVLKVKHVIVVGHYGCGGIKASTEDTRHGLIDNWLRHIQDVSTAHEDQLSKIKDTTERLNRLCELNVIHQVVNVCRTSALQEAWDAGQEVAVHGWVYGLDNGLVRDLNISVRNNQELPERFKAAVATKVEQPIIKGKSTAEVVEEAADLVEQITKK